MPIGTDVHGPDLGPDPGPRPVSPRVKAAAYAVPLCVLPSALWRLHAVFVRGLPPGCERLTKPWEPYYIVALSVFSLAAALLTIGLVRPWGEVVPGWIPVLGGRRVPTPAAVIPAATGAVLIFGVYAYLPLNAIFGFREPPDIPGCPDPSHGPHAWIAIASYAPLLAWGPLLTVVTVAYYRRRRAAIRRDVAAELATTSRTQRPERDVAG